MNKLAGFSGLVLPVRCAVCGTPGRSVCDGCARSVAGRRASLRWLEDGLLVNPGQEYSGALRSCVLECKRTGERRLRLLLRWIAAIAIADLADLLDLGRLTIVPVHSGANTRSRAGRDLPQALARAAARDLRRNGIDARVADLLSSRPAAGEQKLLGRADRAANTSGAMELNPAWHRRAPRPESPLILFDDVVTTGATLMEANRVLRAGGFETAAAATVATARLRQSASDTGL